ncbi:hypothetical protein QR680_003799 [Steinernema hermaphroditum]|uniref:Uncharacterized protein n=1 Tax=Steinernema hermaphroditum TaxID=289476 RepID=A0AA39HMM3_9BILA|nr:hypothetical protein QR680_003799 [Steinernema hermaphroditum]
MDDLPFHFCDTVASKLKNLPEAESFQGLWGAVFQDHQTNRITLEFAIRSEGNQWWYAFTPSEPLELTFDNLFETPSKYLRLSSLSIYISQYPLNQLLVDSINLARIIRQPATRPSAEQFVYFLCKQYRKVTVFLIFSEPKFIEILDDLRFRQQ